MKLLKIILLLFLSTFALASGKGGSGGNKDAWEKAQKAKASQTSKVSPAGAPKQAKSAQTPQVASKKILILEVGLLNGIGDFVHLEELYKIIRAKYPHLNLGISITAGSHGGEKEGFFKQMITSFLTKEAKNLPARGSPSKVCLGHFKDPDYQKAFKQGCAGKVISATEAKAMGYALRKIVIATIGEGETPGAPKASVYLLEYGETGPFATMGLIQQQYGIRVYDEPREFWHKKKNEAFKALRFFPEGIKDWKELEKHTGRKVMVLNFSDGYAYSDSGTRLFAGICEQLRMSEKGLDLIVKSQSMLESLFIEGSDNFKQPRKKEESFSEYNERLLLKLNEKFSRFCATNVAIKLMDDDDYPSQIEVLQNPNTGLDAGQKSLHIWQFFPGRIDDNDQYKAFAFYPYGTFAAGDDSFSLAVSLSYELPMMYLHNGSSGHHAKRVRDSLVKAAEAGVKTNGFPSLPTLAAWMSHYSSAQDYLEKRRAWSTSAGFQKLMQEWHEFRKWVFTERNVAINLEKFFLEKGGEEFLNFIKNP